MPHPDCNCPLCVAEREQERNGVAHTLDEATAEMCPIALKWGKQIAACQGRLLHQIDDIEILLVVAARLAVSKGMPVEMWVRNAVTVWDSETTRSERRAERRI